MRKLILILLLMLPFMVITENKDQRITIASIDLILNNTDFHLVANVFAPELVSPDISMFLIIQLLATNDDVKNSFVAGKQAYEYAMRNQQKGYPLGLDNIKRDTL